MMADSNNWTLKVGGTTGKSDEEIDAMIESIKGGGDDGR